MNRQRLRRDTKTKRKAVNAKTATLVIAAVFVFILLLEFQEFVHLSSRLFYFIR